MTFLNPLMLWGLPLILLPVLVHLFNRLRHRKLPWAAMMFLRMANRKSRISNAITGNLRRNRQSPAVLP
mgnify:CR=1 FL=1